VRKDWELLLESSFIQSCKKKHWEWILETLGDAITSYDILDFATSALKQ